jgi:tetratricopeptide (TPR) repeat protein
MEIPNDLDEFRDDWINELVTTKSIKVPTEQPKESQEAITSDAIKLYITGTEYEMKKDYNTAISYYKKAMRLDSEVEYKYMKDFRKANVVKQSKVSNDADLDISQLELDERPEIIQQNSRLLDLPDDVMILLLKVAIAYDLDLTLRISLTCKKLRDLVKSPSVWKHLCRINHPNESEYSLNLKLELYNSSWLDMWLEKPRVRTDGVYISTVKYQRTGYSETLSYLQPVHMVTYYRYVRFISKSKFILLTTPVKPSEVVKVFLFNKIFNPKSKLPGLIKGNYKWEGETLIKMDWVQIGKNTEYFSSIMKVKSKIVGRHDTIQWRNFTSLNSFSDEEYEYPKKQQKSFIFSRVLRY